MKNTTKFDEKHKEFDFNAFFENDAERPLRQLSVSDTPSGERTEKFIGSDEYQRYGTLFDYAFLINIVILMIVVGTAFSSEALFEFLRRFTDRQTAEQIVLNLVYAVMGLFTSGGFVMMYFVYKRATLYKKETAEKKVNS